MSSTTTEVRSNNAGSVAKVDTKLEIVVLPVSDVDRSKDFYTKLGWRLDIDFAAGDDFRVIQFTPRGDAGLLAPDRAAAWGSAQERPRPKLRCDTIVTASARECRSDRDG